MSTKDDKNIDEASVEILINRPDKKKETHTEDDDCDEYPETDHMIGIYWRIKESEISEICSKNVMQFTYFLCAIFFISLQILVTWWMYERAHYLDKIEAEVWMRRGIFQWTNLTSEIEEENKHWEEDLFKPEFSKFPAEANYKELSELFCLTMKKTTAFRSGHHQVTCNIILGVLMISLIFMKDVGEFFFMVPVVKKERKQLLEYVGWLILTVTYCSFIFFLQFTAIQSILTAAGSFNALLDNALRVFIILEVDDAAMIFLRRFFATSYKKTEFDTMLTLVMGPIHSLASTFKVNLPLLLFFGLGPFVMVYLPIVHQEINIFDIPCQHF